MVFRGISWVFRRISWSFGRSYVQCWSSNQLETRPVSLLTVTGIEQPLGIRDAEGNLPPEVVRPNAIVANGTRILRAAHAHGAAIVIEAPPSNASGEYAIEGREGHAAMWTMPQLVDFANDTHAEITTFDQCMLGAASIELSSVLRNFNGSASERSWSGWIPLTWRPAETQDNTVMAGAAAGAMIAGPPGALVGGLLGNFIKKGVQGQVRVELTYTPMAAAAAAEPLVKEQDLRRVLRKYETILPKEAGPKPGAIATKVGPPHRAVSMQPYPASRPMQPYPAIPHATHATRAAYAAHATHVMSKVEPRWNRAERREALAVHDHYDCYCYCYDGYDH